MASFDVEFRATAINPIGGLTYGTVIARQWADITGDPAAGQFTRLNSQLGAVPYSWVLQAPAATVTAGVSIQLACLIAGAVVADAGLGGELFFAASVLERAASIPLDIQEVATSAVHNITVRAPGHYTLMLQRDSHGGQIVHFDVEAV